MSQLKHSPGPWSLEFDDVPYDGGFETMVINSENGGICMMDCPKDDMEANGNLIAAAPDLLEALEDCERELSKAVAIMPRRYCNRDDNKRCEDLLGKVRAAVRKATEGP